MSNSKHAGWRAEHAKRFVRLVVGIRTINSSGVDEFRVVAEKTFLDFWSAVMLQPWSVMVCVNSEKVSAVDAGRFCCVIDV